MAAEVEVVFTATDNFTGVLGNFGSIVTGIESAIHLAGEAFGFFKDQALQGLDAIASWERLSATMETLSAKELLATGEFKNMTEALAAAGPKAEELLKWIQELAIKSPFTTEGVANAFRTAEAYGFTADEAKRLTEALIDFASGSGATEGVMNQIALALGQIEAKGKLAGQEVLQLVNAGLPVDQILATAFNKTTAEIVDMREKGLIPAKDAIEAITVYLETNFAGAAERQANTWAGLQSTFVDIKEMGLREFFGGLFDALQPLAVELSNFLQTEGMDKLREWGAMLGQFTADIVSKLPDAIAYIENLKNAFDTGGITAAIDVVFKDFTAQDIVDFTDKLDAMLADAINQGIASGAFKNAGDAFGNLLISLITGGVKSKQSEAAPAIGQALGDFIRGAIGDVYFQHSAQDIASAFARLFLDAVKANFANTVQWTRDVAASIANGLINGLNNVELNITNWVRDHIVTPFKQFLGIASPSTVFFDIGRNIVQGLIDGVSGMWNSFSTFIETKLSNLLSNLSWDNILKVITGQMSVSDLFGSSSGGGSYVPPSPGGFGPGGYVPPTTGGGTGSSLGGQTVTLNFYGTVYMSGVPGAGSYDCPSPIILSSTASGLPSGSF